MKPSENPLGSEPISTLLRRFAVPSVIAMLVSALYNMVDQLFIGHSIGVLGNAATNVAFPLSMVCTSIGLLCGRYLFGGCLICSCTPITTSTCWTM